MADSGKVVLQVCPAPADDAGELAELAGWLRGELLDLDVQGVDRLPGEAVSGGAKGVPDVAGWLWCSWARRRCGQCWRRWLTG
jgi:hypothetical protein